MTVLDRVPVDAITEQAKQVNVGRVVLTVLAALLFGLGWLVGAFVLALAWCGTAIKVGYLEGRRREQGVGSG
ncbi:hypothetical protein [Tenggerimyces flavus]|uniref:Uncharacterized protein n=1 Tax=Tenggerimyces flavus TaxID=1708749 RepID=A0ABV7YB38_9ACTN|nr:hypothetical protein [Tenggerimyces flavus]MBM7788863.1 uncharacterized membrane protein YciS (DUF1049 family) [Tenggerimyces flavus]